MGQNQSVEAAGNVNDEIANSKDSSLQSFLAEAAAYGNEEMESIEAKAQKALECPCIADLRSGPCGSQFTESFLCFLKSTAEEKGLDCVHPFDSLQNCIKANPNAFSKDILEDKEVKDTKPTQEYKIIPPTWSKESKSQSPSFKKITLFWAIIQMASLEYAI